MNSAQNNGRNNVLFFFLAFFISVILFAVSGALAIKVIKGDSAQGSAGKKACLSAMRINGFTPQEIGNQLTLKIATNENIEILVYQFGVIVASCPTYELVNFCAGDGCPTPGLAMTLRNKET